MKRSSILFCSLVFLPLIFCQATTPDKLRGERIHYSPSVLPYTFMRDHTSSNLIFTVTNFGMFGSFPVWDEFGEYEEHPGCEFPKGSGIQHLYTGALWVGAIVGEDTLVSAGYDGWQRISEMYPDAQASIPRMTNHTTDIDFNPLAVADEEFVATYYDTLVDPALTGRDFFEPRYHKPLNLEIRQHSYTFGGPPYGDFVLIRYTLKNIGTEILHQACIGLYLDADIWHTTTPEGFADDFSGSHWVMTGDGESLFVAYSADDDGDPIENQFWGEHSARSVFSATFLDMPAHSQQSFNWWVSNGNSGLDWGPRRVANYRPFGTGGEGTPEGDRNKYYMMSHPEIDYNQLWQNVDLTGEGWIASPFGGPQFDLLAHDTRFLLSFGGFDLAPGDSMHFGLAMVLGMRLHRSPVDYKDLYTDQNPEAFFNTLDFTVLDMNVRAARYAYHHWLYGRAGDVDNSGDVDVIDVVALVNFLFLSAEAPLFGNAADVNGDCTVDLSDVLILLRYLYRSGSVVRANCVE